MKLGTLIISAGKPGPVTSYEVEGDDTFRQSVIDAVSLALADLERDHDMTGPIIFAFVFTNDDAPGHIIELDIEPGNPSAIKAAVR